MRRLLAAMLVTLTVAGGHGGSNGPRDAQRLRRGVVDRRLPAHRCGAALLVRWFEHAGRPDPARRAGRRLRLRQHDPAAAAVRKGLVTKPVVFTRNTLVLIVPRSNPAGLRTVYDLRKQGVKLVVAAPAVPVGAYTLQILKNMALSEVLQNVVSRETDVREVLAKVALGEADAGFVYSTEARTVPGKVAVIKLPAWAAEVQYGIAVVTAGSNRQAAQAFVNRILSKPAQAKLIAAGFLPR